MVSAGRPGGVKARLSSAGFAGGLDPTSLFQPWRPNGGWCKGTSPADVTRRDTAPTPNDESVELAGAGGQRIGYDHRRLTGIAPVTDAHLALTP